MTELYETLSDGSKWVWNKDTLKYEKIFPRDE